MVSDLICCNGHECPCKEQCGRFTPFVPTDHPVHWMDKAPYEFDAGCCPEYVLTTKVENNHATAN